MRGARLGTGALVCGLIAACAQEPDVDVESVAQEVRRPMDWVRRADMNTPRVEHVIVPLQRSSRVKVLGRSKGSGRVLVTGGSAQGFVGGGGTLGLASTEIYDEATNSWTPARDYPVPSVFKFYAPLDDGRVLVAGGTFSDEDSDDVILASHVYDPETDQWIATGPLPAGGAVNPHSFMPMVKLSRKEYLVAGGLYGDPVHGIMVSHHSLIFKYDEDHPARSRWVFSGDMPVRRTTAAVQVLRNGKVLVFGGYTQAVSNEGSFPVIGLFAGPEVSLYDPRRGTWSASRPLPSVAGEDTVTSGGGGRWAPFSRVLDDGDVLIAGGASNETIRRSAFLYDPGRDRYRRVGDLAWMHIYGYWAAELDHHEVLFAGWAFSPVFDGSIPGPVNEVYDPCSETFSLLETETVPNADNFGSPMVVTDEGRYFAAGGLDWTGPIGDDFSGIAETVVLDPGGHGHHGHH